MILITVAGGFLFEAAQKGKIRDDGFWPSDGDASGHLI
jgi:hypothetical protein